MKKSILFILYAIFSIFFLCPKEIQPVRFTSYYTNDSTGSSSCTASLLCTDTFQVNKNGWYTYKGKVVMATATYHCTELKEGVCGQYNSLPNGFHQYNLYDTFQIQVEGKNYDAIVLDICGASYWEEEAQRYDIFVSNSESAYAGTGYVELPYTIHIPFLIIVFLLCILYCIFRIYCLHHSLHLKKNILRFFHSNVL